MQMLAMYCTYASILYLCGTLSQAGRLYGQKIGWLLAVVKE